MCSRARKLGGGKERFKVNPNGLPERLHSEVWSDLVKCKWCHEEIERCQPSGAFKYLNCQGEKCKGYVHVFRKLHFCTGDQIDRAEPDFPECSTCTLVHDPTLECEPPMNCDL